MEYNNGCYDGTYYFFEKDHQFEHGWAIHGRKPDGLVTHVRNYNKGRFQVYDGSHEAVWWDYYKLPSNKARQMFRGYQLNAGHPVTVREFVDYCNSLVHTAPEIDGATLPPDPVIQENTMYPTATKTDYSVKTTATNITIAPAASAAVTTKSDAALQRDYLMGRLQKIEQSMSYGDMHYDLRRMFHLGSDPAPKTAKELIDAIKHGKFKLDDKKIKLVELGAEEDDDDMYIPHNDPFYGIIWDGPKPDRLGFEAAKDEFAKAVTEARDTITILDPTDGLAAIKALEAWTPTTKAS